MRRSAAEQSYAKPIPDEPPQDRWWLTLGCAMLIALAAWGAYHNSFQTDYVGDDRGSIHDNPSIRHLWPIGPVLASIGEGNTVQGRPITNLTLAVNYAIGELDRTSYHVTNFLIHVAAALVLFGVVRRTLANPLLPEQWRRAAAPLATAAAMVWCVHPLTTGAVTYIVQRAESLASLFYLLTLYSVIRAAGSERKYGGAWAAAAVIACGMGMGSKEITASAPVLALVYDRIFLSGSFKEAIRRRWPMYAGFAACWGLLAWLIVSAGNRGGTAGLGSGMSPWGYACTQFGAIVTYLKLCVWPSPLVFDYGEALVQDPAEIVPYAIIVAALLALVGVSLWRWPKLGVVGLLFFAVLGPSSSFIPSAHQTIAEHRMYLPSAAVVLLALLAVFATADWLARRAHASEIGRRRASLAATLIFAAAATIALAVTTSNRNEVYSTDERLCRDTISKRPDNPRAQMNLGNALVRNGLVQESFEHFQRAIELKPDLADAYNDRGSDYKVMGRLDKAIEDYQKAAELDPKSAPPHFNLASVYELQKRYDDAIAEFSKAIELKGDCAQAYCARAMVHVKKGEKEAALADFNRTIELDPAQKDVFYFRATLWDSLGQPQQAMDDYGEAIRRNPQNMMAYNNRGNLFLRASRPDLAIQDYNRALELSPTFAFAYNNRASAHLMMGELALAWADVEQCRRVGGQVPPALLEALRKASGRSE